MKFSRLNLAAGLAFLLGACNGAPQDPVASPEPPLVGITWVLRSLHAGSGSMPITRSDYTLRFSDTGYVHGRVACNHLSAPFEATASTLRLTGNVVVTEMACMDDAYSDDMLAVLHNTTAGYAIQDSTLCLSVESRKACFRPQ